MDEGAAIAVLALAAAGVWLWWRRSGESSRQAEMRLRRICLGDERQAERLIENEMVRSPGIPRAEAAARAVQRYQRDNR
jgi:hypothetical protein